MVARIVLWLFILSLGLDFGGGIYELRVLGPEWSRALIDHVPAAEAFVRMSPSAGTRFWIFVAPAVAILAVALLVTGRKSASQHRRWRRIAGGVELFVVLTTFAYFAPTITTLLAPGHGGLPLEAVAAKARLWFALNGGRAALSLGAWLAALRALSLPA